MLLTIDDEHSGDEDDDDRDDSDCEEEDGVDGGGGDDGDSEDNDDDDFMVTTIRDGDDKWDWKKKSGMAAGVLGQVTEHFLRKKKSHPEYINMVICFYRI